MKVNADLVRKNYKNHWSDYRTWENRSHAREYLIYPENISEYIAIDEVTLSKGELYTYLTAKDKMQRNGTLIGSIRGTKAEDIIAYGMQIPLSQRQKVKEVSLDMAPNMKLAAQTLFPHAKLVTDRFHVVKLVLEALQQIRIKYRWQAIEDENRQIAKCRKNKVKFQSERLANGESRKELLARSRFLLFKFKSEWTLNQKERAKILFREYPKLRDAYLKTLSFRRIYNKLCIKKAKTRFNKWIHEVKQLKQDEFNTAALSIQYHLPTILNFFINRSTNAFA